MIARIQHGLRAALVLASVAGVAQSSFGSGEDAAAPVRLADTGLFADARTQAFASRVLAYSPQYPLWTDGAAKRRWILLPPGSAIDASDPDRWVFPVGTKLWKEFSFGRRVETRYMELRPGGEWLFATYLWNVDGTEATLAPQSGKRGAFTLADGTRYDVPSQSDCRACHNAHPTRVLGFGALQLSSDRDPLAPHATPKAPDEVDLTELVARGLVCSLPQLFVDEPPRIDASTPRERAALGYLHGNCASCHNAESPVSKLGLGLEQTLGASRDDHAALRTTLGVQSRRVARTPAESHRIVANEPDSSLLFLRLASRDPLLQMPPFGTRCVDAEAAELIAAWIREDLSPRAATLPILLTSSRLQSKD